MKYKKSILHIDDDPQFTRLVAQRLSALGYEVTSINDPAEAIERVNDEQHRLVLLDIDMPAVNGLDLLRMIKTRCGGTQVIMLTGIVSMQALLQAYRWGAEFFVFKPLEGMGPLVSAVETVFQKIDHWWTAMERLSKERRAAQAILGLPPRPPALDLVPSDPQAAVGPQDVEA